MFDGLFDLLSVMEGLSDITSTTIARYENDDFIVSTVQSSDCDKYETALRHNEYHPHFKVVEEYDELDDAEAGHKDWILVMEKDPSVIVSLVHVGSNAISTAINKIEAGLEDLTD